MNACMCESQRYYFFIFRGASSLSVCFPFDFMQVDEKKRSSIARRLVLEYTSTKFLESPPSSFPSLGP